MIGSRKINYCCIYLTLKSTMMCTAFMNTMICLTFHNTFWSDAICCSFTRPWSCRVIIIIVIKSIFILWFSFAFDIHIIISSQWWSFIIFLFFNRIFWTLFNRFYIITFLFERFRDLILFSFNFFICFFGTNLGSNSYISRLFCSINICFLLRI